MKKQDENIVPLNDADLEAVSGGVDSQKVPDLDEHHLGEIKDAEATSDPSGGVSMGAPTVRRGIKKLVR